MINKLWSKQKVILLSVVLSVAIFFPHIAPYTAMASEILILGLFAMAFDLMLGYAGMLSFSHAAFFGLGAYTTGIISKNLIPSVPLALLGGVIMSSLAGLLIGFLTIRRRGIYFTMVALAFAQMFYFIAFKWTGLTGGDDGLQQVPRPWLGPLNLQSQMVFYYFLLFSVILSTLILIRVVHSPFGRTLQAQRENRNRAMSIG
ncbi:MAG: hypothetical protein C0407_12545 [Desulfobacca sp.]|nr:hypothetical protein [Desulfobacca sp.]